MLRDLLLILTDQLVAKRTCAVCLKAGFKVDAAQWLASHRNITAVGVDTPSPDNRLNYGDGKGYPVHTVSNG